MPRTVLVYRIAQSVAVAAIAMVIVISVAIIIRIRQTYVDWRDVGGTRDMLFVLCEWQSYQDTPMYDAESVQKMLQEIHNGSISTCWRKPCGIFTDAWGNEVILNEEYSNKSHWIVAQSWGPDGEPHTDDDIVVRLER